MILLNKPVKIDLQVVVITGNDGKDLTMKVKTGISDLLNFPMDIDTRIATVSLEVATVQQIRLIHDTNKTVVVNIVPYPLSTPSADQSGLKLQVHQTLQSGVLYSSIFDLMLTLTVCCKPLCRIIKIFQVDRTQLL